MTTEKKLLEAITQVGKTKSEREEDELEAMGNIRKAVTAGAKVEMFSANFDPKAKTKFFLKITSPSVNGGKPIHVDMSNARNSR